MIQRDDLAQFLNDYLSIEAYTDFAPNGIQVEGKPTIQCICTAVTASLEAIKAAAQMNADALLVHHGYFWQGENAPLVGMKYRRIRELILQDISLFAYHLPLDAHLLLGNNACLGRLLDLQEITTQAIGKNANLLWCARTESLIEAQKFQQKLELVFQRKPEHISGTKNKVSRVAWCTGAAEDYIVQAHAMGADTYISGEVSERTYYQAKELNMHYFACGHHATERFGIQALGNFISERFSISHYFLDSKNPF